MNIEVENDDWMSLAMAGLESAYGENEPEYSLNLIIEPNPNYISQNNYRDCTAKIKVLTLQ